MNVNIVLFKKDGSHKAFPLANAITVIGRRHDCELRIPLKSISRRHCQLSLNKETFKLRDLGSRNGTYVNGKRINEAALQPGDYIKVGPLTFLLQIDGQPKEIIPPDKAVTKKAEPAKAAARAAEDELDLLPELDEDASDSFLAELEDL